MKQVDSKYKWKLFLIGELSILFSLAFFYVIWSLDGELPEWTLAALMAVMLVFTVICWLWSKWTYRFFKYEIGSENFRRESGVIYKKYTTIPYSRIQNIDINRGIFDRILGLSCVSIQTAGSSNPYIVSEGEIPGLPVQVAEQIKEELIQKIGNKEQGL